MVTFVVGLSIGKELWLHEATKLERTGAAQPSVVPQAFALLGACLIVLFWPTPFALLFVSSWYQVGTPSSSPLRASENADNSFPSHRVF